MCVGDGGVLFVGRYGWGWVWVCMYVGVCGGGWGWCVCVCVLCVCVCVEDRKELELRGVCPRHLCVRPPRYTCTSIRAAIIDTWPTNYWF